MIRSVQKKTFGAKPKFTAVIRQLLVALFGLLILSAEASSQSIQSDTQKEAESKRELRQKTFVLVDEIGTGAFSLKLPENRAFVLAETADLLWPQDEKRARNLFWDAYNTTALIVPPKSDVKDKKKSDSTFMASFSLRRQILHKAAGRDYRLAMDLMNSAPPVPPELASLSQYLPDLEQELAAFAGARDPKRALEFARASLAKQVNYQLIDTLLQLHDLDPEISSKFAGEIIERIQTKDLSADFKASGVAVQLLTMSRTSSAVLRSAPYQGEPSPLKLTAEQKRQLVEVITNAALGLGQNSYLLYALTEIMPEIEEFAPGRVALAQKKVAAFNQSLNQEQRSWQQYNAIVRGRSPEEILAAAQTANEKQRRMLEQEAVVSAVLKRRAAAFREYVETEIKDENSRRELLDALNTEQISAATNRGDADELRSLLPNVRVKEERARAMAAIAVLLEKKGDHDEALKLLSEAQALIRNDFSNDTQTNALLAVMAAWALVEPAKAFSLIESVIDNANDQITKLLLVDKIISSGVVRKGEIVLQRSGVSPDFLMSRYGRSLVTLAKVDFDRTKTATDRLERPELRLLARLMLAQMLLAEDAPKRWTIH
jgi:hypothetical protein